MGIQPNNRPNYITFSRILLFVAVIMFTLAAFGIKFASFNLTDLALAFFAASFFGL